MRSINAIKEEITKAGGNIALEVTSGDETCIVTVCPSGNVVSFDKETEVIDFYGNPLSTDFQTMQNDAVFLEKLGYETAYSNLCLYARDLHS